MIWLVYRTSRGGSRISVAISCSSSSIRQHGSDSLCAILMQSTFGTHWAPLHMPLTKMRAPSGVTVNAAAVLFTTGVHRRNCALLLAPEVLHQLRQALAHRLHQLLLQVHLPQLLLRQLLVHQAGHYTPDTIAIPVMVQPRWIQLALPYNLVKPWHNARPSAQKQQDVSASLGLALMGLSQNAGVERPFRFRHAFPVPDMTHG